MTVATSTTRSGRRHREAGGLQAQPPAASAPPGCFLLPMPAGGCCSSPAGRWCAPSRSASPTRPLNAGQAGPPGRLRQLPVFYGPQPRRFTTDKLGGYYVFYDPKGHQPGVEARRWPVSGNIDQNKPVRLRRRHQRHQSFSWQGLLVDPVWWRSAWNTVLFTVVSVVIETILGLVIAMTLNTHIPGRGLLRAAVADPLGHPHHRLGQDVGLGC